MDCLPWQQELKQEHRMEVYIQDIVFCSRVTDAFDALYRACFCSINQEKNKRKPIHSELWEMAIGKIVKGTNRLTTIFEKTRVSNGSLGDR